MATLVLLSGLVGLAGIGCGSPQSEPAQVPSDSPVALDSSSEAKASLFITLGDIDPDEPTKKIERFQPLADYLARRLGEFGVEGGRVTIARSIKEMGRFMRDGTVDVYFDSPFPALAVQNISGSEVILRRWKGNAPSYWSTYVALNGSGVSSVQDLLGKVLALDEPHSTSGFILPAGNLIQQGFTLVEMDRPDAPVAPDVIGYLFTGDEKNTFEYVRSGLVAAGAVSNQDYDELPAEIKLQLTAFGQTLSVPRQLVLVRPGLEPGLVRKIRGLLIGLEDTNEGLELLKGLKDTQRFDALPAESTIALGDLKELINLVTQN